MKMKRVGVCLLSCLLLIGSITGCANSRNRKIDGSVIGLTVDDTDVNMGTIMAMLRYHQCLMHDYYENMYNSYASSGMVVMSDQIWDTPVMTGEDMAEDVASETEAENVETTESEVVQETVEETASTETTESVESEVAYESAIKAETYGDQFINNVMDGLVEYLITNERAADYGVELTDAEKSVIMEVAEEFYNANDADLLALNGISVDDIANYLEIYTLYQKVYHAYLDSSDVEINDEDARCMKISYVQFSSSVTGDNEESQAAIDDGIKADAESFLSLCKTTEDIATVDLSELSDDYASAVSGSEVMAVHDVDSNYIFSVEDIEAIGDLQEGEVYDKVLYSDDGAAYVIRLDERVNEEATEEFRKSLRDNAADDAFVKDYDSWRASADVQYNEKVLSQISVTDKDVYTVLTVTEETETDSNNVGSSEEIVTDVSDTEAEEVVESEIVESVESDTEQIAE